MRIEEKS
jgi:hypothetical protein